MTDAKQESAFSGSITAAICLVWFHLREPQKFPQESSVGFFRRTIQNRQDLGPNMSYIGKCPTQQILMPFEKVEETPRKLLAETRGAPT